MRTRILVVDDEPDMVELLTYVLRHTGWTVFTATNGVDALKRAQRLRPDLILLDLMLPGLDGFAVCEQLRESPTTRAIPVLLLTAMSGDLPRYHGLIHGASDYIRKPFKPADLVARIQKALREGLSKEARGICAAKT